MSMKKTCKRFCWLLLAACTLSAPPARGETGAEFLNAAVTKYRPLVERVRNRPFKRPVAQEVLATERIRAYLLDNFDHEYTPPMLAFNNAFFAEFNLVPPGMDLKTLLVDLLTAQIGGFYDPATRSFYMAEPFAGSPLSGMIIAHELTHALQDGYLPLEETLKLRDLGYGDDSARLNDDTALARIALIEGEAQEVTGRILAAAGLAFTPDYLRRNDLGQLISSQIQLSCTPAVIANQLIFPYTRGQGFIKVINRRPGWVDVNAAYADLPCSTEQIIHPEKYLAGETPVVVTLPGLAALGDAGWTMVATNTLGEFMADEVVRTLTGCFAKGVRAAAGWAGDTMCIMTRGPATLVVWYTVWDTPRDAVEFHGFFNEGLASLAPAPGTPPARYRLLALRDSAVAYASAPDPDTAADLLRLCGTVELVPWNIAHPPATPRTTGEEHAADHP
ncbi:MAG: hypothetical protein ABIF71_04240 [Planctomycetota bacterium]